MLQKKTNLWEAAKYFKKYKKMLKWNLRNVSSFDLLLSLSGQKNTVLDVGCGIGYLSKIFPKYVGVDVNICALKIAKRCHPTHNFVCASVTNLPFRNKSFRISFAYDVIEHVNDVKSSLSEMARVSERFLIGCIDFTSWYGIFTRTFRHDSTHCFEPSRTQLITLISHYVNIEKVYLTCGIFTLPRKLNQFFARFFPEYVMMSCLGKR